MNTLSFKVFLTLLCLFLVLLLNVSLGSVSIPFFEVLSSLFAGKETNQIHTYILYHYRLPKSLTAVIVGSGLGISGLLMQTFFRNPLAGPYILGVSSGASLGVAIVVMGSSLLGLGLIDSFLFSKISIILASAIGSFLVLVAILLTANKIKDTLSLLIIGLMFASLSGAVVNILSYFSTSDELQQYVFWSLGSLGDLSWSEVGILGTFWVIGLLFCLLLIKSLDTLLIGEDYAKSLGVPIKKIKYIILFVACILTGSITAFVGPIAFIGLAIPHLVRLVFKSNKHIILLPAVCCIGALALLICDSIAQLPGIDYNLPINAVTSIIGSPIVIWLILKNRKLKF